MAIIKCPECGKNNVSDTAEACPECGYEIKAHFEKIQQEDTRRQQHERRVELLKAELQEDLDEVDNMPYPAAPQPFVSCLFSGSHALISVILLIILIVSIYSQLLSAIYGSLFLLIVYIWFVYTGYKKIVGQYHNTIQNWETIKQNKKEDIISDYWDRIKSGDTEDDEQYLSNILRESNIPRCPTCGSTNIEKITITSKVVGGALFGLLSSDVRRTFHCRNCDYKW